MMNVHWDKHKLDDNIVNKTVNLCVEKTNKFKGYYLDSNRQDIFLEGKINATVLSGSPTKTTLCNTLRMYSAYKFVLTYMGIPPDEYQIFASGDDVIIVLEHRHLEYFRSMFSLFFAENDTPTKHGLGYIVKSLVISEDCVDFLSKYFYFDDDKCCISRKVERVVKTGNVTFSKISGKNE